jgi:hypothetical protein
MLSRVCAMTCCVLTLATLIACAGRSPRGPDAMNSMLPATEGTGLQLITWTLDAASVLEIAPPETAAVAPRTAKAWEDAGMLIARVPERDIAQFAARLTFTTQPQQQLLAFSPSRGEALRGDATQYDTLRLDTGSMPLRNAAARMLVRSWPVPGVVPTERAVVAPTPAAVQLELTPQVLSLTRPRRIGLEPMDNSPEAQGVVLSRLVLETTLARGEALVIYPANAPVPTKLARASVAPEQSDVPAPPRKRGEDAAAEPTTAEPLVIEAEESGPALPTIENLPTFGDALLTDALALPREGTRRVLIIIARPPASYSLLRAE